MEINKADSIKVDEWGMKITSEGKEISLSWGVIDQIAEESLPHYQSVMLHDFEKDIKKANGIKEIIN